MDSESGSNSDRHPCSPRLSEREPGHRKPLGTSPESQRPSSDDPRALRRRNLRRTDSVSRAKERIFYRALHTPVTRHANRVTSDGHRSVRRHSSSSTSRRVTRTRVATGTSAEPRNQPAVAPPSSQSASRYSIGGTTSPKAAAIEAIVRNLRLRASPTGERSFSSGARGAATSDGVANSNHTSGLRADSRHAASSTPRNGRQRSVPLAR